MYICIHSASNNKVMKKNILIGRAEQQDTLTNVYQSKTAELVAITGRRRVGKTYLVKTYFDGKIDFEFSGILNADNTQQLKNFSISISTHFKKTKNNRLGILSWMDAFHLLSKELQKKQKKNKLIVFIDEFPWLDSHKSGFLPAFDWFWNSWAVNQNIALIICGSATSWMINKIINNKGGLHNRVTKRIHLEPFTLQETESFLKYRNINLSRYQLLQLYMAFGGVPHYLKEIKKGESAIQNIHRICFTKNGLLINEFENLYRALFNNASQHIAVIFALASKLKGLTREEILKQTKIKDGGTFSTILSELEWSGFIMGQSTYGKLKKETFYRLTDEYSLFYIRFMYKKKNVNWQQLASTQSWKIWSGYAFENICLKHTQKIKNALGIGAVYTEVSGFLSKGTKRKLGTQIDLVINRNDQVINICEAKFYDAPFTITKSHAAELQQKLSVFQHETKTKKTLFLTIISTYGISPNKYSVGLIQNEMTMDALFN